MFGLSAGAALRHVLNCADVIGPEFATALGKVIAHPDWRRRREAIDDDVERSWDADRELVDAATGDVPAWSVDAALRRPSAARFDALTEQAASRGLLDRADADALRRA